MAKITVDPEFLVGESDGPRDRDGRNLHTSKKCLL